jgi:hypothetical protein
MDASDELLRRAEPSALLHPNGIVRSVNGAMAMALCRPAEQCVGRYAWELVPENQPAPRGRAHHDPREQAEAGHAGAGTGAPLRLLRWRSPAGKPSPGYWVWGSSGDRRGHTLQEGAYVQARQTPGPQIFGDGSYVLNASAGGTPWIMSRCPPQTTPRSASSRQRRRSLDALHKYCVVVSPRLSSAATQPAAKGRPVSTSPSTPLMPRSPHSPGWRPAESSFEHDPGDEV